MPYRINPENKKEVQVKRGGKWVLKKRFSSAGQAEAYKRALKLNVTEEHK
jgi:hypothetical protein